MAAFNVIFALPRALVSQNKRRYRENGYDLDLCYLHPRVIVMGYPSIGFEQMYRNPRSEVVRFLETNHSNQYQVYNFCDEKTRSYPSSIFGGRVKHFPIEDHNVPSLDDLYEFCEDAAEWLHSNEQHVVALHCKAGKGRGGLMACALLLRMGFTENAQASIQLYNKVRVNDYRGLTVVSQRKWVQYYEKILLECLRAPSGLSRPILEPIYHVTDLFLRNTLTGVTPPVLRLRVYTFDNDQKQRQLIYQAEGQEHFELDKLEIHGSVLFEFRQVHCGKCIPTLSKHIKIWFNTKFLQPNSMLEEKSQVIFQRNEMDWVSSDKKKQKIPAAMELEMQFMTNM